MFLNFNEMDLNSELEKYILDHSCPEDEVLADLHRQTHVKIYHPRMVSGHEQGKLLEFLVRMINPSQVLEIGTYTGYSAISIARGLSDQGKLTTIEINDELEDFIRGYFKKAGVEKRINLLIGDALKVIPELNEQFDLVFIDGEKDQYCEYYKLIFEKVKPGGFILADNVLWSGKVIEKKIRDNDYFTKGIREFNTLINSDIRVENIILPMRDGLNLIRKK